MTSTKERLRRMGVKALSVFPVKVGEREPSAGDVAADHGGDKKPRAGGYADPMLTDAPRETPEKSTDPLRPSIRKMPKKWQRRLRRLVNTIKRLWRFLVEIAARFWYLRPWRELTPEEALQKQQKKELREMEKLLRREARLYIRRIRNRLTALGHCYRYKKHEEDFIQSGVQEVRFSHVAMQRDAINLRINTMKLPRNVSILSLIESDVLTDLSIACRHRVTARYNEKFGAWYIIERATGVHGIPRHVDFSQMIETLPKSSDGLTYPLGKTRNGKRLYRSLTNAPHALIAGATGNGKSNMVNAMLATFIMRNAPADLRIILVDLKGGLEFTFFEGIPHLLPIEGVTKTGIIERRERVPDAIEWLINEGEKRMDIIKDAGHKDIGGYNARRRKNRLGRILFVIDEWADIALVPRLGAKAEDLLTNVTSRMRATGIHVVLSTQSPKREVIKTLIKNNLPVKMAFACSSNVASILILDNADANGLEPAGRFVYQHGADQVETQAPFVSDHQLRQIVSAVTSGEDIAMSHRATVPAEEIIEYAIEKLGGKLTGDDLFQEFQGRLSFHELIDMLKSLDGHEFEINGVPYVINPPRGSLGRSVEFVNFHDTVSPVDVES